MLKTIIRFENCCCCTNLRTSHAHWICNQNGDKRVYTKLKIHFPTSHVISTLLYLIYSV